MRAVVARVSRASVTVEGKITGQIGQGYLVLLGVGPEDTVQTADRMAEKICNLRVFEDEAGKMNRNLAAVGGSILAVSQFTLYADTSSRRPGFSCREKGFEVQQGVFGADMAVESVNDGPVTILLEVK